MTHTPRTAEQIRAALQQAARDNDGAIVDDKTRWAVISQMEKAWQGESGPIRKSNRKAATAYLFGHPSTKQLSDAHIRALADWLHDFDFWSDLRTCLRQALKDAGQLELEAYRREDMRHDAEMYQDELDNKRANE